jgi:hypothetical protein
MVKNYHICPIRIEIIHGRHRVVQIYIWAGSLQGRIQDFKLGGALKEIAPSGGRREKFWGISCEKSRFYAKKSYFFQF